MRWLRSEFGERAHLADEEDVVALCGLVVRKPKVWADAPFRKCCEVCVGKAHWVLNYTETESAVLMSTIASGKRKGG
jgi:hypothetical protein